MDVSEKKGRGNQVTRLVSESVAWQFGRKGTEMIGKTWATEPRSQIVFGRMGGHRG